MADQYTEYLRFAYSPYRTFAQRMGGYLDPPPVVPTLQNAASIPSASEVGTQVVGAMPATQPTVQPQPMVTLPPDPTLSEDLRRFIPRRVQDPFDFSQFRYPEAPKFRMPGMAPTRNLAEEQGYTRRVSLKAALLGALLGGGTGAIAGLTGAQQGAQQSFEQDYAQRMADYQNQARLMDIENQQLASADQRAIAMRNAQMQDAIRAYDIEGQRMQVQDQNAQAEQSARLALADARAKSDAERAARITRVIEGSLAVVPEDRAAYIRSGLMGEVPTAPLRAEVKATGQLTGSNLARIVADFNDRSWLLTPGQFVQERADLSALITSHPDPTVRLLVNTLIKSRPNGPPTIRGLAAQTNVKRAESAEKLGKARLEAYNKWSEARIGIQRKNVEIAGLRERRLASAKPKSEQDPDVKNERQAIESQFKALVGQLNGLKAAQLKDKAAGFVPEINQRYDDAIADVRAQIQQFATDNSGLYEFSNLESGMPTFKPRRIGAVPAPGNPNPPRNPPRPNNPPPPGNRPPTGRGTTSTNVPVGGRISRGGVIVERVQ